MKLNERVYGLLNGNPIEVQKFDDRVVEVFMLNDYPEIMNEYVNKGKFAVWSSVDGVNYRLAVESGYYETLKELYDSHVNSTWIKFWDECEKISSGFTKKIVLPGTCIAIVAFVLIAILLKNYQTLSTYLTLGLAAAYVLVVLVLRKTTTKKINDANINALDSIKKYLGTDKFNELLDAQRKYIDNYFDSLNAQIADEEEVLEETTEQATLEENTEKTSEETEESPVEVVEDKE